MRFEKPGDFLRFKEAGFEFFLILDRGGNLNGFHNTCRHRAYPILAKDDGNVPILHCKYHGWSYGLKGNLAKAPQYQDLETFDKSKNGLFPVHVHVDALGFVWVNLDGAKTPTHPWDEDLKGVDTQERFKHYDISKYRYDHSWDAPGDFNWKALADNYNECYHCPTTHPDVPSLTDLTVYDVAPKAAAIQHFTKNKGSENNTLNISSTYYFPNACMTLSPHFMYMMRCVSTSATTSHLEYQVFRHVDATDEEFNHIDSIFKRVLGEDKDLCNAAQKNLSAGTYVAGELHPKMEKGALYIQSMVRQLVKAHYEEEQKLGRQIWPARQSTATLEATNEDDAFCAGLACDPENGAAMAW
ncbi:hypothetical protein QQX98_004361 [Neonectria punicea]|uniref:Choline monooxygenase, chloroplastic n=1 Tax=Neonectria punicea TaxID=979145 RepID=A0ABR1H9C4_9HYPO